VVMFYTGPSAQKVISIVFLFLFNYIINYLRRV